MKLLKKITALITAVSVAAAVFVFPSSAAVYEWDGKAALEAGNTYIITSEVKVRGDVTIPEGTKLSVKKGGSLLIYKGATVSVGGNFAIAIGGSVTSSAKISIAKTGALNIYGDFSSSISGSISSRGAMTVYNKGVARISSTVLFYKTASVLNKGSLSFLSSSDVKTSTLIESAKSSTLQIQGIFAVTLSGSIESYGYMSVGRNSQVKSSGIITLDKDSVYNRFGDIKLTKSGRLIDNRPVNEHENMTVSILVDEPDVEMRGIDVSYAQGDIDWKKVANSGVEFAIIRIARGATETKPAKIDDCFIQNIKGAQENGIEVGVYFYSYATSVAESRKEAEFLVDVLKDYTITFPIVLDMEEEEQRNYTVSKLTSMIEAFFDVVMNAGYYPMLYSYKYWLETGLDMKILDKYAIWLAQINDEVTYEGGYYIWQYSYTGTVSGIDCTVDLDICYRNFPEIFRKYGLNHLS